MFLAWIISFVVCVVWSFGIGVAFKKGSTAFLMLSIVSVVISGVLTLMFFLGWLAQILGGGA